jgi:thiol-disulfide isomerase/thioredoxin
MMPRWSAAADLQGKVVLIDFCTYTCINRLRTLPYVRAWAGKYKAHGLVLIGVHSPELLFEHDPDNVRRAVKDMRIEHPIAIDNSFAIWQAFRNRYWPARYLVDARGAFVTERSVKVITSGRNERFRRHWTMRARATSVMRSCRSMGAESKPPLIGTI